MKIAINKCYGGFDMSAKAIKRYLELKGLPCYFYKQTKYSFRDGVDEYILMNTEIPREDSLWLYTFTKYHGETFSQFPEGENGYFSYLDISRDDSLLIQTIEELGEEASGRCGNIVVIEIPDGVDWEISEGEGFETVEEKHRSWC